MPNTPQAALYMPSPTTSVAPKPSHHDSSTAAIVPTVEKSPFRLHAHATAPPGFPRSCRMPSGNGMPRGRDAVNTDRVVRGGPLNPTERVPRSRDLEAQPEAGPPISGDGR